MAIVNVEHYEWLSQWNWTAFWNKTAKTFYAVRKAIDPDTGKRRTIWMHRLILNVTNPKLDVDHDNHNGLDNRLENLRIATRSQSMANRRLNANSKTGLKGVHWHKRLQRWEARIRINGEKIYLGLFDTPEQAHEAYMRKAYEVFGAFACDGKITKKAGPFEPA